MNCLPGSVADLALIKNILLRNLLYMEEEIIMLTSDETKSINK